MALPAGLWEAVGVSAIVAGVLELDLGGATSYSSSKTSELVAPLLAVALSVSLPMLASGFGSDTEWRGGLGGGVRTIRGMTGGFSCCSGASFAVTMETVLALGRATGFTISPFGLGAIGGRGPCCFFGPCSPDTSVGFADLEEGSVSNAPLSMRLDKNGFFGGTSGVVIFPS